MMKSVILSVDEGTCCIEAAFLVKGSWIVNRIHQPLDAKRKPLDLSNIAQVNAYVLQYAIDNYQLAAQPQPADGRVYIEQQDHAAELHALWELLLEHSKTIAALEGNVLEQTKTNTMLQEQADALKAQLDELQDQLAAFKDQVEARDEAVELVFEKFRSQLRRLERLWWRKIRDAVGAWWDGIPLFKKGKP